jgi:hypothetical protein
MHFAAYIGWYGGRAGKETISGPTCQLCPKR